MSNQALLLIDLTQSQVDTASAVRARSLLGLPVDWEALLTTTDQHGMSALMLRGLRRIAPDQIPATLPQLVTLQLGRTMAMTRELTQALASLADAGIPAITFKGPTLAVSVYGDLGLRPFGDLDILVRPDDFEAALALLSEAGYRPQRPFPWECHLVHGERGTCLDLHAALSHDGIPYGLDFDQLEARAARIELDDIAVACPDAEDLLLLLCVHLAKDMWDVRSGFAPNVRLIKLADIAELVRRREPDWDLVLERAQTLRVLRILRFALGVVRQVYPVTLPAGVVRSLKDTPLPRSFPGRPNDYLFGGAKPFSGVEELLFQLRIRDRLRDRVALIFTPTSLDEHSLSLPPRLRFLHYLTRPLRMAGRYGRQLLRR